MDSSGRPADGHTTGSQTPMLRLAGLTKRYGPRKVVDDVSMDIAPGEMICVLGPSGCGKTTTLRMIGGFERADEGRVSIDGLDVTEDGPERRPTSMVFQNYALWPHLTAFANIAYGLRIRHLGKSEIRARVGEMLELVGLEGKGDRRPGQLSGGEQQRVALARALVLEPKLLLMDEPLSNLDAQLRMRVREELVAIQRRTSVTMVFVTHDQDEALSIADRVAVMRDGRLEQLATGADLYRRPATTFVAGFIGRINWIEGRLDAQVQRVLTDQGGALPYQAASFGSADPAAGAAASEIGVRPENLRVRARTADETQTGAGGAGGGEAGSAQWAPGRLTRRITRGHFDEVLLDSAVGELRAYIEPGLSLPDEVEVRAAEVLAYRDGQLIA